MNNQQIIKYIKIREAWREDLRAKSRTLSTIWSGLFRFSSFLAYYAVEKYFLSEEIARLYESNPNYKYIFYLSLAFGLWGIIDGLFGVIKYFQANEHADYLRRKVEKLEKGLSNSSENWQNNFTKDTDNINTNNMNNNKYENTNINDMYSNTNTTDLENNKEEIIKHHPTRFIIYLVLWLCSTPFIFASTFLGGLIGSIGGISGAIYGALAFFWIGIILVVVFLILWVYHLIKWLNA